MKKYAHISETECNQIVVYIHRGKSIRHIANLLGRSVSSISREIKRNFGRERYRANTSHKRAVLRHRDSHTRQRLKCHARRIEVENMLRNYWSPEIIAGRLKQDPALPGISHEAIYQWIYADVPHMIYYLIRSHQKRWPKGKSKYKRVVIKERTDLSERPVKINKRAEYGHWEADLIIGKGCSAIQVLVERKSRTTRLLRIPDKTASSARNAIYSLLFNVPGNLKTSITYDNGFENSEHHILNKQLGTVSYFCRPYHAWEKGTVENTNSLIRRFLPKRTNFDIISDDNISKVEAWLNYRPRKCLNFKSPLEAFASSVALTT